MAEQKRRKPISKKLRFEIFKRDNFTCQYCGRKAPDVVLELEHIIPVAKGGTNSITNLVTACYDCNHGKGARLLNDNAVVNKQRTQLELLNEKKNQIEMIAKWEEELLEIEATEIDIFMSILPDGYRLSENGILLVTKYIKKYGFQEVLNCLKISLSQYYKNDLQSIKKVLSYLPRICHNRKNQEQNPYLADVNKYMYKARYKLPYLTKNQFYNAKKIVTLISKDTYRTSEYEEVYLLLDSILESDSVTKTQFIYEINNLGEIYGY